MLPRTIDSLHLDTVDVEHPKGPAVLCLPGLFTGSWAFERLLPLIAERGYPAASLSYRGRPPNASVENVGTVSITDYVRDAATAAAALHRPIAIGHSLGGLISLMLARRDHLRAAVLISSAPPRGIPVFSWPLLARMTGYLPSLLLSRPLLPGAADVDALVLNKVPVQNRARVRSRFTADSGRVARQITLGTLAVPAGAIRIPLFIVTGDDDRFVPPGVARKLAQRYKAPLHVAHGHGHFLFEEPGWEAHARVILDWIDALPGIAGERHPPENALPLTGIAASGTYRS
ncbi:MAG: putative Alpha/beta hydrolase fold [Gemmatimonadetes bacterium]|nr:putative Alpha/beta hydrolase fold [Gemmatimonadota bacterium]